MVPEPIKRPEEEEMLYLEEIIQENYVNPVSEWLVRQKPKIRTKFISFLKALVDFSGDYGADSPCNNVAERFAKDIAYREFHPVIHFVMERDNGEFSDCLNLLSSFISRSNISSTVTVRKDDTSKIIKAAAQEDHIFQRSRRIRHQAAPTPQVTMNLNRTSKDDYCAFENAAMARGRSYKPVGSGLAPFAQFPTGDVMKTTSQEQFKAYPDVQRQKQISALHVLNSPTVL